MRKALVTSALLAALGLALAACGGNSGGASGNGYGASPKPAATTAPAAAAGVGVMVTKATLGDILTDPKGRTLYVFTKDKGDQSACSGACASSWPALTTTGSGAPQAGSGVDAGKLATAKQANGSTQVTYDGHPLYYFAGDSAPGQTNGQGLNKVWWVVGANGTPIMTAS
jgi:predicted lipoprotein with Yx(FWY)xxD motif